MRRRLPSGQALASTIAVGVASTLLVAALWRALTGETLPQVERPSDRGSVLHAGTSQRASPGETPHAVALAFDPFSLDRRVRPTLERAAAVTQDTTAASAAGLVRLLGTVVRGTGGFAICQLSSDLPRIVHVGDRLGDLTLISIEQGRARFRTAQGSSLEISLSRPGP